MMLTITIFFFILGAIIGSFLNVVILRHNTGVSIDGRSGCMTCSKQLKWYELFPILSYLFLKGRCSKCKSRISIQYPLVELANGLLFMFLYLMLSDMFLLEPVMFLIVYTLHATTISLLVVIFVYDIYHKIIPDVFSYSFALVAFILMLVNGNPNFDSVFDIANVFSGVILFLPFYLLWVMSNGKWIGLGDGKLALGIGWFLGLIYGISALVVSFWVGAIVSVGIMLIYNLKHRKKGITMKSEIPFAPFLIIGTLFELFFQIDVMGLSLLIS